ncbi:MAG TPA: heme o synthase [Terriglobales bacterium]|nr:heme o synthase [Terriglobales bacterium]
MSSSVQSVAISAGISARLHDYAELTKLRVTSLILLTAWTGFYFAAFKSGVSSFSWTLLHALIGIGLVSAGTAGFNEVIECETDSHMRRTATRPLPAKRMGLTHACIFCSALIVGGATYLCIACNALTALLTLATSVFYLGVYTPLKRVSPICTFMGAFSGAMPPLLGWTALRDHIDFGAIVLFGILFFWQFPHFYSIAWLYREDYENAAIRMLPVVHSDGRSTAREIMVYSGLLVPMSLLPTYIGMAGRVYLFGAFLLSSGLFYYGLRLALSDLPADSPRSKAPARHLLRATVMYLPLLFILMMLNVA